MKLEELTALGMTEDIAKKTLELSAAEGAAESAKLAEAEGKLTAATATIADMTAKVKVFDGVDVGKLQTDIAGWEEKYNTDLAAVKTESAIDMALVKAGAKDNGLVKTLLDKAMIKLDVNGTLLGFAEQLNGIQKDKTYLFASAEADPNDTGMTTDSQVLMDSAGAHGGIEGAGLSAFEAAAKEAAGLPTTSQTK